MLQFFIVFIIIEWKDWYSVFNLESEGVNRIVYDDYVFEFVFRIGVSEHAEILDVDALLCLDAGVPVEAVGNELLLRV